MLSLPYLIACVLLLACSAKSTTNVIGIAPRPRGQLRSYFPRRGEQLSDNQDKRHISSQSGSSSRLLQSNTPPAKVDDDDGGDNVDWPASDLSAPAIRLMASEANTADRTARLRIRVGGGDQVSSTEDGTPLVASGEQFNITVTVYGGDWPPAEVQAGREVVMRVSSTVERAHVLGTTISEISRSSMIAFSSVRVVVGEAYGYYTLQFSLIGIDNFTLMENTVQIWLRNCRIGQVNSPGEDGGCRSDCAVLQYNYWPEMNSCRACEPNGVCPSGGFLTPEEGYWQSDPRSPQLHRCFSYEACEYGPERAEKLEGLQKAWRWVLQVPPDLVANYKELECRKGYHGNLCGVCDWDEGPHGFGKNGLLCGACPHKRRAAVGTAWVMIGQALIVGLQLLLYIQSLNQAMSRKQKVEQRENGVESPRSETMLPNGSSEIILSFQSGAESIADSAPSSPPAEQQTAPGGHSPAPDSDELDPFAHPSRTLAALLKVVLDWVQMLGIIRYIQVNWPSSIINLLSVVDVTSSSSGLLLYCSFTGSSLQRTIAYIIFSLLIPLMFLTLVFVVWILLHLIMPRTGRKLPYSLPVLLMASFWVVSLYFHPSTSQHVISIFSWVKLDDPKAWHGPLPVTLPVNGTFWSVHPNTEYFQDGHRPLLLGAGIPSLIIYALGLPIIILAMLVAKRKKLRDFDTRCALGMLYADYNMKFYWWQAVTLTRQLLLIACVNLLRGTRPAIQMLTSLCVLVLNHHLLALVNPYADKSVLQAARWVLFTMVLTLSLLLFSTSFGGRRINQQTDVLWLVIALNLLLLVYLLAMMAQELRKMLQNQEVKQKLKTAVNGIRAVQRVMRKGGSRALRKGNKDVPDQAQLTLTPFQQPRQ